MFDQRRGAPEGTARGRHAIMSERHSLGPRHRSERPAKPRGWLERCCTSRCTPLLLQSGPEHWRLDDASEESRPRRYRALFPSPSADDAVADVVEQCGVPLLAFSSGDLLEEAGAVPATHAREWALGTVRAAVGSRDDQVGRVTGEKNGQRRPVEEPAPSPGLFPLEYTAPVLAEPRLHRAIHRFKESAAAADRGEMWFLEGDDILVTAMISSAEGASGMATHSWAYGHLVRGARAGTAGLVPLGYLAVPTRQGAMEGTPSPRARSPIHSFGE